MNIEYIRLSDGTTAVTDEFGKIEKRNGKISSDKLLIENKNEVIDNQINKAKKKAYDWEGTVFLAKNMLISQPMLFGAGTLLGYIFGNVNGAIYGISAGLLVCIPASIMWAITLPISKKKLKGYEGKLAKANELKRQFEKELTEVKELPIEQKTTINRPISLGKANETEIARIDEELYNAYYTAKRTKTKKLVLNRKTNRSE